MATPMTGQHAPRNHCFADPTGRPCKGSSIRRGSEELALFAASPELPSPHAAANVFIWIIGFTSRKDLNYLF
jgi:hypothetical protein